jgi:glycosyltransferase involved in cell wall biosynthesis
VEHASKYSVRRQQRIPDSPPVVEPLGQEMHRPLWSVMIPVYNCSAYLEQTLERVLSEDQGPDRMQIEVVDDCSTDADVSGLVQRMGKGRVSYFRQPENVGSLRNFHTCLQRSRGYLVHLLHGDDRIRKGFYEKMYWLFGKYPSIGAAFCRYAYINESGGFLYYQESEMGTEGILDNWLLRLGERQRIQYAAMVVKREVYESVGGFYGVEYGEDWEMWMRIAAHYQTGYTPEVLAEYRKHYSSISGKAFVTAENMASLDWVMQKIHSYLPANRRKDILHKSRNFYAHYSMRVASALWKNFKDRRGASAQALAAWHMSRDAGLLYKIIKLYTRITLNI